MHFVCEIFDVIQRSTACHLKHAQTLKQAIEKDEEETFTALCVCIRHVFSTECLENNFFVKRIINFVAVLASLFKLPAKDENAPLELHPTLEKLFHFILKLSESAIDSHRYWSCALFNRIFQDLEELTDELYEDVKNSMLQRLKDNKTSIRCHAIIGLNRLQDSFDEEDEIVSSFCTILQTDFSAKVRRLCLEKICINKRSLPLILERIRDVDVNVRLVGFQRLQSIAKCLKVSQKRLILQCGFFDSSEKIKQFTSNVLVQAWLEIYDNDYINFISSIRYDSSVEDIKMTTRLTELVLAALFKSTSIETIIEQINVNEEKMMEYDKLNWDTVLYYRISVEFLRKSVGFEDHLNTILPELVQFCCYIKGYFTHIKQENENFNELQHQFIVQQFFLITQGYDVADVACRQCLNSLVHYIIQAEDLSTDTAEIVIKNLIKTMPNVNSRTMFVCEIISDIKNGEDIVQYEKYEQKERERLHVISQLQSEISTLEEEESYQARVKKDFIEAERVKNEIENKKSKLLNLRNVPESEPKTKTADAPIMIKCLTIAEGLLLSPTITSFTPAIATLNSDVIQPALMYEDDKVRVKALKCYALCCIIDFTTARYGIHLFCGLLFSNEFFDIEVLITSLKITGDLLTMYGLRLIEKSDEEEEDDSLREEEKKVFVGGTSLTDIVQAFADYLNHEDLKVQEVATKAVCVLLTTNVTSSSLLSRIIIKWASPATENEKLKQFIGFTLNLLVKSEKFHTYFADTIISTIRTVVYARQNSPMNDISLDNIIKFMLSLGQMSTEVTHIQTNIAYQVCQEMCQRPRTKIIYWFSKVLCQLTTVKDEAVEELLAFCDDLRDVISDAATRKNINKFNTNLSSQEKKMQTIRE